MRVELNLDKKMRIVANNEKGLKTNFDAAEKGGGDGSEATPMEVMLETVGACSFMDVISILRKRKKTVEHLKITIDGERKDTPPKVFTKATLRYELTSPDADQTDLEKAISLSQDKYCGASAMFKAAGCNVSWEAKLIES